MLIRHATLLILWRAKKVRFDKVKIHPQFTICFDLLILHSFVVKWRELIEFFGVDSTDLVLVVGEHRPLAMVSRIPARHLLGLNVLFDKVAIIVNV